MVAGPRDPRQTDARRDEEQSSACLSDAMLRGMRNPASNVILRRVVGTPLRLANASVALLPKLVLQGGHRRVLQLALNVVEVRPH
jgi:hypothetical protein